MNLESRGNFGVRHKLLVGLLFLLPACIVVAKLVEWPGAEALSRLSLDWLPQSLHRQVRHILVVPFGAMAVVFTRLTLGLRVLGPMRSILIAIAMSITGVVIGLLFLSVILLAILAFRPLLKGMRLPYFGRVTAMVSLVAVMILAAIVVTQLVSPGRLGSVAYFPIVVLTLMGDRFALVIAGQGLRVAMIRLAWTVLLAVLISQVAASGAFSTVFFQFPELLLTVVGAILVICEYGNWRLLEHLPVAAADLHPIPGQPEALQGAAEGD